MSIFKSDGNNITLNTDYCEFYLPVDYFADNSKFGNDYRDYINVIGVFNIGIFENGKFKEIKVFNVPTFIDLQVYDYEMRDVDMGIKNGELVSCKVLKYYKGQEICKSSIIEDSSNVELFLNMIISGALPRTIPYDKVLDVWRKNLSLNHVSFGVPSTVLELVLAVMYRNPEKYEEKFSKYLATHPNASMYDYVMVNIRQVSQYNSTFTAVTFEDMDSMITTSLNRSRENKDETISPVEQVIKM